MEKFPDMQGKYREFGRFFPYYIRKGAQLCIVLNLVISPKFPKIITGNLYRLLICFLVKYGNYNTNMMGK